MYIMIAQWGNWLNIKFCTSGNDCSTDFNLDNGFLKGMSDKSVQASCQLSYVCIWRNREKFDKTSSYLKSESYKEFG